MLKKSFFILTLIITVSVSGFAQNTNTNTTETRSTRSSSPTPPATKTPATRTPSGQEETAPTPPATGTAPSRGRRRGATRTPRAASPASAAAAKAVRDAFDTLIDGIRRADVGAVMGVYWNSPQLLLFNNNGTVTRSWEQVRANRVSSYPNLRDVRLDVRDVRVSMLGADAALVTCLWSQTQTAGGTTDSATGRLTLIFQNIGGAWKVVHTHTSPDRPDPSRLLPSERTSPETESTTKPPVKP